MLSLLHTNAGRHHSELLRDQLLSRLVANSSKTAYRIACDFLGDRAAAEDAVQDSLTRVCRAHASLRDGEAAEAWFLRIVVTSCLRTLRRRRLRATFFGSAELDQVSSPVPDGEQLLANSQQTARLLAGLARLPTMQRACLILRYGHDLPVAEIARLVETKASTVKTHLVRGLRRMRVDLQEVGQ